MFLTGEWLLDTVLIETENKMKQMTVFSSEFACLIPHASKTF